jgi:plasmid maintenance system antidote protein VapI
MAKETVLQFIQRRVKEHGSQRAYAKHLGVSQAYLSDVINGRRDISKEMAQLLGYKRLTIFVKTNRKAS